MERITAEPGGWHGAVHEIYQTLEQDDWRLSRCQGLHCLQRYAAASSAVWHTSAFGHRSGVLTQSPGLPLPVEQLFASANDYEITAWADGWLLSLKLAHFNTVSRLISQICIYWRAHQSNCGAPPKVDIQALRTLAEYLVHASDLTLSLFVQQDDRLEQMGRSSRGLAALVDAEGAVFAATDRFLAGLGKRSRLEPVVHLPFPVPSLAPSGAANLRHGGQHWRLLCMGGLYSVHVRQPQLLDVLSPREQQIAYALAKGLTFKSIAAQCQIAVSTVANHASRIYRKLGVFRREELMALMQSARIDPVAAPPRRA
jgi:DNA-binding NarL/FixJ family response regulator